METSLTCNMDDFGRGGYPEPWYAPPTMGSSTPKGALLPSPNLWRCYHVFSRHETSENVFHSFHANNNSWSPWEGPPLPSNRWHEQNRVFQSHEHPDSLRNIKHLQHTGSSIIMKKTNFSIIITLLWCSYCEGSSRIWKIHFGQVSKPNM